MTKPQSPNLPYNFGALLAIFLVSVALIGLQLALMRTLSVTHYYHFSYLVISTALLGFGASGTLLSLAYPRMKTRPHGWMAALYVLFVVSVPLCYYAAQQLPLDIQYVFFETRQQLLLAAYNLLVFVPFFIGATIIGFALTYYKHHTDTLYGANLLGSGIGGVAALGMMPGLAPAWLPYKMTAVAFLGLVSWVAADRRRLIEANFGMTLTGTSMALAATLLFWFWQPPVHFDPYKDITQLQRLERQGDAERVLSEYGPRGEIDVFSSPTIHQTLFAGPQADTLPPGQLALLMDGNMAGTIFRVDDEREAAILDETPQSLAYRLTDRPRVLLLGEVSGVNVWLAQRFGAEHVTVVQTNPRLLSLLQNELAQESGNVLNREDVTVVEQSPRHFLDASEGRYDIIQLVSAEGMAAGTGGLQSLNENYLLTVEAMTKARRLLNPGGFVSVTRGLQNPPRDNIKLFALFHRALERGGADEPGRYLLQGRNYLAANTLMGRSPVDSTLSRQYRQWTARLTMDIDYMPGLDTLKTPTFNMVSGPGGTDISWYRHAAEQVVSGGAEAFFDDWVYDVRPPTDNQPYFYDFFKWSSLDRFVETYGQYWFQRLELGYAVLVLTFAEIAAAAFILILLPLLIRRRQYRQTSQKLPTLLYFLATGFGFIMLEMVLIQKFTRFMGDPIFSISAAMTSLLVFAGAGSIIQKRTGWSPWRRIRWAALCSILVILLYGWQLEPLLDLFVGYSTAVRFTITVILLMPLAFFLGWLFPAALEVLQRSDDELVPWAWGLDGFASVAGAPLAVMLAIAYGFQLVLLIAVGLYTVLLLVSIIWGRFYGPLEVGR